MQININHPEVQRRLKLIRHGRMEEALAFQNNHLYGESDIFLDDEYKKAYLDTYKIYKYEWIYGELNNLMVFCAENENLGFIPLVDTAAYGVFMDKMNGWIEYENYSNKLKVNDLNYIHNKKRYELLLQSLESNGFDQHRPILIDADNRILDGQHRAAWLMATYGKDAKWRMLRIYTLNSDFMDFFPYEKVSRGSKLLIYGIGAAGRSYIEQINYTKYGEVVGLIDKNPEKWDSEDQNSTGLKCFLPEQIETMGQYMDYIIIASRSKRHAIDMKDQLINLRINVNMIVSYF